MSDSIIQVENLSKRYRIGEKRANYGSLRESFSNTISAAVRHFRNRQAIGANQNTIWALRDISFEVKRGEVLGIIGRNGAGKSTLLKVLSRITRPTAGRATIHGRVGSLLEVGTGFHPELTGRENIYLNGAILGMSRVEIDHKFDEIVDFAEIEQFLETPVKHYSSGMYMRLGFAVAAHLDPEILLVDEVLSVGDAIFQNKCIGKMKEVSKEGRTVIFVSHNMGSVSQLCTRSILLSDGSIIIDDITDRVIYEYLNKSKSLRHIVEFDLDPFKRSQITSMAILSEDGQHANSIPHTDPFLVQITYQIDKWYQGSYVCLDVFNETDVRLIWSSDVETLDEMLIDRRPGTYEARVKIPGMTLSPGDYYFTAAIFAPGRDHAFDAKEKAISVKVIDGGSLLSNFGIRPHAATMLPLSWDVQKV